MRTNELNLPEEKTFIAPALVWKRTLAFIGDFIIINLVIFLPWRKLIQNSMPQMSQFNSYSQAYNFIISTHGVSKNLIIISFLISLFAILYFALLEYKTHQTPGKIVFNIFIINDAKNGINKITFWQCLIRSLFLIPLFPFFLLWIIDPLFMCFTKSHQRLSEILSKTRTVNRYTMEE